MANTISRHSLIFQSRNLAGPAIRSLNTSLAKVKVNAISASEGLAAFNRVTRRLVTVAGAAAVAVAALGIKMAASMQTLKVSLAQSFRSLDDARRVIEDMRDFSKSTPFTTKELLVSADALAKMGIAAGEVRNELQFLGDVATTSTRAGLSELILIYGQVQAKGRLMGEELMQLRENGFQVQDALANHLGIALEDLEKRISKGEVSFDDLRQAMINMSSAGGIAFKSMELRSQTLEGRWSTLLSKMQELVTTLGEKLLPHVERFVELAISLTDKLDKMSLATKRAALQKIAFAGAFLSAIVIIPAAVAGFLRLVAVIRTLVASMTLLKATTLVGLGAALAGLVAGAAAAVAAGEAFDAVVGSADELAEDGLDKSIRKALELSEEARKTSEAYSDAADGAKKIAEEGEKAKDAAEKTKEELKKAKEIFAGAATVDSTEGFSAIVEGLASTFKGIRDGRTEEEILDELVEINRGIGELNDEPTFIYRKVTI